MSGSVVQLVINDEEPFFPREPAEYIVYVIPRLGFVDVSRQGEARTKGGIR